MVRSGAGSSGPVCSNVTLFMCTMFGQNYIRHVHYVVLLMHLKSVKYDMDAYMAMLFWR